MPQSALLYRSSRLVVSENPLVSISLANEGQKLLVGYYRSELTFLDPDSPSRRLGLLTGMWVRITLTSSLRRTLGTARYAKSVKARYERRSIGIGPYSQVFRVLLSGGREVEARLQDIGAGTKVIVLSRS